MNRITKYFAGILLIALALLSPQFLQAQSTFTLDGLAERLQFLDIRLTKIEDTEWMRNNRIDSMGKQIVRLEEQVIRLRAAIPAATPWPTPTDLPTRTPTPKVNTTATASARQTITADRRAISAATAQANANKRAPVVATTKARITATAVAVATQRAKSTPSPTPMPRLATKRNLAEDLLIADFEDTGDNWNAQSRSEQAELIDGIVLLIEINASKCMMSALDVAFLIEMWASILEEVGITAKKDIKFRALFLMTLAMVDLPAGVSCIEAVGAAADEYISGRQ